MNCFYDSTKRWTDNKEYIINIFDQVKRSAEMFLENCFIYIYMFILW